MANARSTAAAHHPDDDFFGCRDANRDSHHPGRRRAIAGDRADPPVARLHRLAAHDLAALPARAPKPDEAASLALRHLRLLAGAESAAAFRLAGVHERADDQFAAADDAPVDRAAGDLALRRRIFAALLAESGADADWRGAGRAGRFERDRSGPRSAAGRRAGAGRLALFRRLPAHRAAAEQRHAAAALQLPRILQRRRRDERIRRLQRDAGRLDIRRGLTFG